MLGEENQSLIDNPFSSRFFQFVNLVAFTEGNEGKCTGRFLCLVIMRMVLSCRMQMRKKR